MQAKASRQFAGKLGETFAANYFYLQGHKILSQNFKTKVGEIDLITIHLNTIYFIEVKFSQGFSGQASDSYPYLKWIKKQKFRLLKSINFFLLRNPQFSTYNSSLQFIWLNQISSSKIKLYKFQNIELNYD
jgi:putative endonuclease